MLREASVDLLELVAREEVGTVWGNGTAQRQSRLGSSERILLAGAGRPVVEEVTGVEARIGHVAVDLAGKLVGAGLRDGVHGRAETSAQIGFPDERRHLEFLNRLDRLWKQREEALAPHADVLVVVVGPVDGEVVR